jgi:hypothetical protein
MLMTAVVYNFNKNFFLLEKYKENILYLIVRLWERRFKYKRQGTLVEFRHRIELIRRCCFRMESCHPTLSSYSQF